MLYLVLSLWIGKTAATRGSGSSEAVVSGGRRKKLMRWMYSGSNTSLRWSLITSASAFDETCYGEKLLLLLGNSKYIEPIVCYLVFKETEVCTHPKHHQVLFFLHTLILSPESSANDSVSLA